MTSLRRMLSALTAALVLTLVLGGAAEAGTVWCVKDPIFEIDGRVVRVEVLVPAEKTDAPVHFVLRVATGATVSWHLPKDETLLGSVTIIRDVTVPRDTPRLFVRGEGPRFSMRVHVSGDGLRTGPYEVQGDSRGLTLPLLLINSGS